MSIRFQSFTSEPACSWAFVNTSWLLSWLNCVRFSDLVDLARELRQFGDDLYWRYKLLEILVKNYKTVTIIKWDVMSTYRKRIRTCCVLDGTRGLSRRVLDKDSPSVEKRNKCENILLELLDVDHQWTLVKFHYWTEPAEIDKGGRWSFPSDWDLWVAQTKVQHLHWNLLWDVFCSMYSTVCGNVSIVLYTTLKRVNLNCRLNNWV